jgi:hypothetical protein
MTTSIELRQLIGEGKFKEALTEIASSLVEMAVTTNLTGSDEEISLRTYFNLASGQIASEVDRSVLEHPNYESLQDLHERKIAVIGRIWHQNLTVLNNLATMQASGSLPPLAVDNADGDDLPTEVEKEEDSQDTPPPTGSTVAGLEVLPEKPAERSTALTADPENEDLPPVVVEEEPAASLPSENAIAAAIPGTIEPPAAITEEELEEEIRQLSPIPSAAVDTPDSSNPRSEETTPETPPQLAIVSPLPPVVETPNAETIPETPPQLAIVSSVEVETPPTVASVEPPAIETPEIPFSATISPPPQTIVAEKVVPSAELAPTADIPDNERVDDRADWDSWLPEEEEEVPPEDSTPTPTSPPVDNTLIPDWGVWMETQKEGVADVRPPRKEPLTRINEWESFAPDNFGLNSPGIKPANPSATTDPAALPQDTSEPDFTTKFLAALDRERTDDDRKLE